jgi:hypothetical protein
VKDLGFHRVRRLPEGFPAQQKVSGKKTTVSAKEPCRFAKSAHGGRSFVVYVQLSVQGSEFALARGWRDQAPGLDQLRHVGPEEPALHEPGYSQTILPNAGIHYTRSNLAQPLKVVKE